MTGWLVSFLFCCSVVVASPQGKRFEVFKNTISPSGRYALAWGFRGREKVDFDRIRKSSAYLLKLSLGEEMRNGKYSYPLENYVVDVRRKAIIARAGDCQATSFPGFQLSAHWDCRDGYVIVTEHEEFSTHRLVTIALPMAGAVRTLDLLARLRRDLFTYLDRVRPGKFKHKKNIPNIEIPSVIMLADGSVRFDVLVGAGGMRSRDEWLGIIVYHFNPHSRTAEMSLRSIRPYFVHNGAIETTYVGELGRRGKITLSLQEIPVRSYKARWVGTCRYEQTVAITRVQSKRCLGRDDIGYDRVKLIETSDTKQETGWFMATFDSSGALDGNWHSSDGKRSEHFRLVPQSMRWMRPTRTGLGGIQP